MFFLALSAAFICGLFFGFCGVVLYALSLLRRHEKKRQAFATEMAKIKSKTDSAKERINKAFDICERQFEILSGLEGPQNGPMHGKHKQKMNAELKALEEEKMTLLKSVLADGHDPKLVTMNERGEKESIKLSDFIARRDMQDANGQKGPRQPAEPVKKKLSLVKNNDKEIQ